MDNLEDITRLPDDFDGQVRLFPLPELVLFPHAMQPLHIFEPRYCELLLDALATDRLIAMATLDCKLDHWTDKQPPIASEICIGKIVSHAEVEGERHNILLLGAKRARIRREKNTGRSFRIAEVEVLDDFYTHGAVENRPQSKRRLLDAFAKVIPSSATTKESLSEILAGSMGLGPITDIIAYTLPLATEDKLRLLSVNDVDARAEHLIDLILKTPSLVAQKTSNSEVNHPFPPRFSKN